MLLTHLQTKQTPIPYIPSISKLKIFKTTTPLRKYSNKNKIKQGYLQGMQQYIAENEKTKPKKETCTHLFHYSTQELKELKNAIFEEKSIISTKDELGDVVACVMKAIIFFFVPQQYWDHPTVVRLLYLTSMNAGWKYGKRYLEHGCVRSVRNCICELCGKKRGDHKCHSSMARSDGICQCGRGDLRSQR